MTTQDGEHLPPLNCEVLDPEPILSDRAYGHAKRTVEGLRRSLEEYRVRGGRDLDPGTRQLTMDAMQSLIDEWSEQLREYEQLKSGNAILAVHSLWELPTLLVKARVAAASRKNNWRRNWASSHNRSSDMRPAATAPSPWPACSRSPKR